MDYFQRFLNKSTVPQSPTQPIDRAHDFSNAWSKINSTLLYPDERQLSRGIKSTDVPLLLKSMVDSLVWESTRIEEGGTGACLEYLLKNDILGTLVRLSEVDRPSGIQAEVLRAVQNMVVLLDEQFLVHSVVHRAVLRLLRNCVGDDIQEQLDGKNKAMGAAGNVVRTQPSEYEEDLVNLLCILCSRIRTYRELLMIFFHDKHWYHSEPLFAVEEEDEAEDDEEDDEDDLVPQEPSPSSASTSNRDVSPTPSQATITSAQPSSVSAVAKKTEYEFLLFNYLLRFVHREGKIGEFARAGLLFLMDVALSPNEQLEGSSEGSDPITDAALALAEYILDGDFSDVLGAGLGAVYSVLPSKLSLRPPSAAHGVSGAAALGGPSAGSESAKTKGLQQLENLRALGIEDAQNPDFKSKLDHFLKLLEFLQDVVRRNAVHDVVDPPNTVGSAIVQSILDSVRRIFMENVLYPHILECSDLDGSAVAVMSYIEIMIRTLQQGSLSTLLVEFLMTEDNEDVQAPPEHSSLHRFAKSRSEKQAKSRRRQSSAMTLLEMEAPQSTKQSEYFTAMGRFTLKDLLLANLYSQSQPTAAAALQLLQTVLLYHPQLSIEKLLLVIPDKLATAFPEPAILSNEPFGHSGNVAPEEEDVFRYPGEEEETASPSYPTEPVFFQPDITYSTHEREMGLYMTLLSRVDPSHNSDAFSTGYDHYLGDALFLILGQPSFTLLASGEHTHAKHRLNVSDPVMRPLLDGFRNFFTNSPQYNMVLTGVLATLAIHPERSLAGWLTFSLNDSFSDPQSIPNDSVYQFSEAGHDGDDRSIDFKINEELENDTHTLPAASVDEKSRPIVHTIFHGLIAQLDQYRQLVKNFDKFLLERRRGLIFSENLSDALTILLDINEEIPQAPHSLSSPLSPSKPKPKQSATSTFVSLLTPKKSRPLKPVTPSEPTTPSKKQPSSVPNSPFTPHYQQTEAIVVESFAPPMPASNLWTTQRNTHWEDDDPFAPEWGEKKKTPIDQQPQNPAQKVTLSQLLDNVVILEESIKEVVAIIQARRSLGIDAIRYI